MDISNPFSTVTGQTAPEDGICLKNYPVMIRTDEVISRYIHVRFGDESGETADAISSRYNKNIIISDNVVEGHAKVSANNWDGGVQPADTEAKLEKP